MVGDRCVARSLRTVAATLVCSAIGGVVAPATVLAVEPAAPRDVARTDLDTAVSVFVTSNDLDADGDGFSVVAVADPARGTASSTSSTVTYTPDAGTSGIDEVTYTLRDSTGATSLGTLIVHVDSGAAAAATSPQPDIDYFTADQGSTVSFSAAELLRNDQDPQGQDVDRRARCPSRAPTGA